jgi:hypothetical protein
MRSRFLSFLVLAALGSLSLGLPSCNSASSTSSASFEVTASNLATGDTWLLNRPIRIFFNNAVDKNSVNFSSVTIRPTDANNLNNPVTGTFTLIADDEGRKDHGIEFVAACPTNLANDNGGFVPGARNYEIFLPTQGQGGNTVLRDSAGRQLSIGLTRTFATPAIGDDFFSDTALGPPAFVTVGLPDNLGLLSGDQAVIDVTFDQSIDPSPENLGPDRLFVQYANSNGLFPPTGNVVAGTWIVVENCGDGATLEFRVSGVLLPGRLLRVVMTSNFLDLAGLANATQVVSQEVTMPTLAETFANGPAGFDEDDVAFDGYRDDFLSTASLDLEANLPQPQATIRADIITARFEFPGEPVDPSDNFVVTTAQGFLEIDTTSNAQIADGLGRVFTVTGGILNVNDFTIEAGATLRAVGTNPLIIYVNGEVEILGTVDASGFHASVPDGGSFHPELVVAGAMGVLGGGQGGDASTTVDDYTIRGEAGDGPFGASLQGGKGGEGGYTQDRAQAAVGGGATFADREHLVAGGGGGGGFAVGHTDAVTFDAWGTTENPTTFDNAGPDLRQTRHTIFNATLDPETFFTGAEDGLRGSAVGSQLPEIDATLPPHGVHGYEDFASDTQPEDFANDWDSAQTGADIDFDYGNPTAGPDGGDGGPARFTDGDASNDFFGQRFFWDGVAASPTLVTGELLAPSAGAGGGASGDLQTLVRYLDNNLDMLPDTLSAHWPDVNFPFGGTGRYFRGAGGGGGGGQIQIMALGTITIGPSAVFKANGGNGSGGESVIEGGSLGTTTQVSGSGAGSGGHIILQTATGLNLAQIAVGTAGNPGVPATFFDNLVESNVIQAIGGRRGWSMSDLTTGLAGAENGDDGNGPFNIGRGGAGASGVVQIHVPDPLTDITYEASVDAAFKLFVTGNDLTNPIISDRQDQILALYAKPQPFTLVPFFSPQSQVQSDWIDSGLAGLRNPANGTGPFPDYNDPTYGFAGIDPATGLVLTTGNQVAAGAIVGSDGGAGTASFTNYTMTVTSPSSSFPAFLLRNPNLMKGYEIVADVAEGSRFEIVAATYQASPERLVLTTRVSNGPMALVASTNWVVREKFFGISTTDTLDRLPASASVRVQFQGTDETTPGSNEPDPDAATAWTGDGTTTLTDLKGKRFIRYRVTFDIDALNSGATLDKEKPALLYMTTGYGW